LVGRYRKKGVQFASDGTYIYVASYDEGIRAYTFSPTESSSSDSANDNFGFNEIMSYPNDKLFYKNK
jgi:hypothetical protein